MEYLYSSIDRTITFVVNSVRYTSTKTSFNFNEKLENRDRWLIFLSNDNIKYLSFIIIICQCFFYY